MRALKRHSATLSAWSLLARATMPACSGAGFLYIWSELKIGWADGELFLCLRALNIVAGVVVYIGLQVRGARQAAAKVMLTVLGTFYVLNMVDAAASPTELLVARYTKVTEDFRALGAFVNMTVGIMAASQPLSTLHLAVFIVTISFLSIVDVGVCYLRTADPILLTVILPMILLPPVLGALLGAMPAWSHLDCAPAATLMEDMDVQLARQQGELDSQQVEIDFQQVRIRMQSSEMNFAVARHEADKQFLEARILEVKEEDAQLATKQVELKAKLQRQSDKHTADMQRARAQQHGTELELSDTELHLSRLARKHQELKQMVSRKAAAYGVGAVRALLRPAEASARERMRKHGM